MPSSIIRADNWPRPSWDFQDRDDTGALLWNNDGTPAVMDLTGSAFVLTITGPGLRLVLTTAAGDLDVDLETNRLSWPITLAQAKKFPEGKPAAYTIQRIIDGKYQTLWLDTFTGRAGPNNGGHATVLLAGPVGPAGDLTAGSQAVLDTAVADAQSARDAASDSASDADAKAAEAAASAASVAASAAMIDALDERTSQFAPLFSAPQSEAVRQLNRGGFVGAQILDSGGIVTPLVNVGGAGDGDRLRQMNRAGFVSLDTDQGAVIGPWTLDAGTAGRDRILNSAGFVLLDGGHEPDVEPVVDDAFDLTMLFPKRIAIGPDRPLVIRVSQLFPVAPAPGAVIVSASSVDADGRPWSRSSTEEIAIDPSMIGSTLNLSARLAGGNEVRRLSVTVDNAATGTGAKTALFLGDSITNRQLAHLVEGLMEEWGYTPTFIGTIEGSSSVSSTTNADGPLGEGREGWALSDYCYTDDDGEVSSILSDDPGDIADYLAETKAVRRTINPFLNGSNEFDFAAYLSRFGFDPPDFLSFSLMMNDILEETPEQAVSQIETLLPVMLDSIRAACPDTVICIWFVATTSDPTSDARIGPDEARAAIAAMLSLVHARADADLRVAPVWACQSTYDGWAISGTPDSVSGITDAVVSDIVHPIGVARAELAEIVASYWAAAPVLP